MHDFFVYDVFTDTAYAGNPLAIVEDAAALSTAQMQAIAREFNLSETIFLTAARGAPSMPVRIFTPAHEMPFAGHPTIGCAVHLATHGVQGDIDTVIQLEELAGPVPVKVRRSGGAVQAEFQAPVIPGTEPLDCSPEAIAGALGLPAEALGAHTPHITTGGHPFIHVQVRDRAALSASKIIGPAFQILADGAGTGSIYVYAPGDEVDLEARMFAPLGGIGEDPATGSATALLAAQLLANGALAEGETVLKLCQGRDMGRKSDLSLRVIVQGGALAAVHVGGSAVPVSSGQIAPPG